MKFPPFLVPVAAVVLVVSGCGQTGALYLPSDTPEAAQDAAGSPDDPDTDGDDDRPATPDDTP